MSNRTWACVPCGKTFRRIQSISQFKCPDCGQQCEWLPWRTRVPPATHRAQWLDFWRRFQEEKQVLAARLRGEEIADGKLLLLDLDLTKPPEEQCSVRKWKQQKRRTDAAKDRREK